MIQFLIILATIIAAGILWHMGGQGVKWARAVAFPGLLALVKTALTYQLWPMNLICLAYFGTCWAMLAGFSYGLNAPPHKFWVWVFGKGGDGSYKPVEIATRATCGFFWSLAAIVFAAVTGGWVGQIIYTVALTILTVIFGLQSNVKVSEIGTGSSVALSILV